VTIALDELLAHHARLGLDANLFIYLFETGGPEAVAVRALLNTADAAGTTLLVASLALAEAAVYPATIGDAVMADRYADAIRSINRLHVVPLTADIAIDAGILRGLHGLSLPDAIHLASARQAGASVFITNDQRLRGLPKLDVIQLADLDA
jgi:predicted nucleic acid-binding protein